MEMLKYFGNHEPKVDPSVYIADTATVVGDVEIGEGSSVWFGAVIRGDNNTIKIGKGTNIQDCTVIHADPENPVVVGDNVTVGHRALLHGCTVGNNSLIGMGAIVLNGAVIGNNCMVAAGALVTGRTVVPDNSMILGAPAKIIKPLTEEQLADLEFAADEYKERGQQFKSGDFKQARGKADLEDELDIV